MEDNSSLPSSLHETLKGGSTDPNVALPKLELTDFTIYVPFDVLYKMIYLHFPPLNCHRNGSANSVRSGDEDNVGGVLPAFLQPAGRFEGTAPMRAPRTDAH